MHYRTLSYFKHAFTKVYSGFSMLGGRFVQLAFARGGRMALAAFREC